MATVLYHDWSRCQPPEKPHKHPGGHTDLRNDPRQDNSQDDGGWAQGARGIARRRTRSHLTRAERNLAQRQHSHDANPPMADGSQVTSSKPRGIRPGSLSGRKH